VPEPTLYLFDGHNLLHASTFADARELRDALASFVATKGARGILVFDGHGADERHGPLEVQYAAHADSVIERLAVDHRQEERVCVVSSDAEIRNTAGVTVAKLDATTFVASLEPARHVENVRSEVGDRLDAKTRAQLDRLRRER
jgi:predicted RNA-binding protein with PIN domain